MITIQNIVNLLRWSRI